MKQLSSRHHPIVAACRALARGRSGADAGMLLDGPHLVAEAIRAGLRLRTLAMTPRALASGEGQALAQAAPADVELLEVSDTMMEAMSPVTTPSGVVAIAARPDRALDEVFGRPPQLLLAAVDVQEPGNAGAIVRAAEACGATGVVFCGASADPFGWKALRGSMGSSLRVPLATAATADFLSAARAHGVAVLATTPHGGRDPRDLSLRQPVAFVLGGEGPGLAADVLDAADLTVSLPMQPPVESLNVAVAAALLAYEAFRQRRAT